jgi:hypothetical protein
VSEETFVIPCKPRTVRQVAECVDPGDHHAKHRKLTDLWHFSCNCGYSSGWRPEDELPMSSTDFIMLHLPDRDFLERERIQTLMELGCTCHE